MRYTRVVKKWIDEYCKPRGLTNQQFAAKLGVKWHFVARVCRYYESCPYPMVQKLAKILDKDPEIVGLIFGYYPTDWIWFTRAHPEKALKLMIDAIVEETPNRALTAGTPKLQRTPQVQWVERKYPAAKPDSLQTSQDAE